MAAPHDSQGAPRKNSLHVCPLIVPTLNSPAPNVKNREWKMPLDNSPLWEYAHNETRHLHALAKGINMPGLDQTGPMGAGPRTGRGMGGCGQPANAGFGRGRFGRGGGPNCWRGRGGGGGGGGGRGWGRGFGRGFGWQQADAPQPAAPPQQPNPPADTPEE